MGEDDTKAVVEALRSEHGGCFARGLGSGDEIATFPRQQ